MRKRLVLLFLLGMITAGGAGLARADCISNPVDNSTIACGTARVYADALSNDLTHAQASGFVDDGLVWVSGGGYVTVATGFIATRVPLCAGTYDPSHYVCVSIDGYHNDTMDYGRADVSADHSGLCLEFADYDLHPCP